MTCPHCGYEHYEGYESDICNNCDCDITDIPTDCDESMDGDFDTGMASAGFGTDEDYGYYGDGDDW